MRYGIDICTLGDFAEPARVVELARAAEEAGWEAVFVWDHLAFAWGVPSADPWVLLSAVAQATTRIRIGTAITPLPRRRPVVVANAAATLDRLSGGRLILGVGIGGVAREFAAFGEPEDARTRADMLDEALEVITALWKGSPVNHAGKHYTVDNVTLAPLPVQRPRVPIWVGGESRAAQRRAARWDGWIINGDNERGEMTRSPESIPDMTVAMTGVSSGPDDPVLTRYPVAWWLEHLHGQRGIDLLARVQAGPPGPPAP